MADNLPNLPSGAAPQKATESAKIQPKKETVRISLPPKPTAAPTIKLPALPSGPGPTGAAAPTSGARIVAAAPAGSAPVAVVATTAGTAAVATPAAPRTAPAPASAPRAPSRPAARVTTSALDVGLAFGALVVALAVLVRLFLLPS